MPKNGGPHATPQDCIALNQANPRQPTLSYEAGRYVCICGKSFTKEEAKRK